MISNSSQQLREVLKFNNQFDINMTAKKLLHIYKETGTLSHDQFTTILEECRIETVEELRNEPNHQFAGELFNPVVSARRNHEYDIGSGDNIMFVAYILGLHQNVEDCLKIWEAKRIDFDSHCYVDGQLVVFKGVEETIRYLKGIQNDQASKAIEYIESVQKAGDFDELETYFLSKNLPWWI